MIDNHDLYPDELCIAEKIKLLNLLRRIEVHDGVKEAIYVSEIRSASSVFTDNQWERILAFAER